MKNLHSADSVREDTTNTTYSSKATAALNSEVYRFLGKNADQDDGKFEIICPQSNLHKTNTAKTSVQVELDGSYSCSCSDPSCKDIQPMVEAYIKDRTSRRYKPPQVIPGVNVNFNSSGRKSAKVTSINRGKWPKPDDVYLLNDFALPRYDGDLFPPQMANLAETVFQSTGVDPACSIISSVAACGIALDKRIRLRPTPTTAPGWRIPATLFSATVADPSERKSPGTDPSFEYLKVLQKDINEGAIKAHVEHRDEMAIFSKKRTNAINSIAKGEGGVMPTDAPTEPLHRILTVTDSTVEGLQATLTRCPWGTAQMSDEIAQWFASFGRYNNGGGDQPIWIKFFDGDPGMVVRVGGNRQYEGGVSVHGNIQPEVMRNITEKLEENGLLARFIMVWLRPVDIDRTRIEYDPEPQEVFDDLIRGIASISQPPAIEPLDIYPTEDAERVFNTFFDWNDRATKKWKDSGVVDSHIIHARGKANGVVTRLALIFHHCAPSLPLDVDGPRNIKLTAETAQLAVDCYRYFFLPHILYFHHAVFDEASIVRMVADRILAKGDEWGEGVSAVALKNSIKKLRRGNTTEQRDRVRNIMGVLDASGWVKPLESSRADSDKWTINPAVWKQFSARKELASAALNDVKQTMKADFQSRKESKQGEKR